MTAFEVRAYRIVRDVFCGPCLDAEHSREFQEHQKEFPGLCYVRYPSHEIWSHEKEQFPNPVCSVCHKALQYADAR